MRKEAFYNDSVANPAFFQSPDVFNAPDLTFWDTTRYTDWQKTLIGGTAKYSTVNAGVSGGTGTAQYRIGGTYQKETSIFPGNSCDLRGGMHINLDGNSLNGKFKVQLSGRLLLDKNQLPRNDLTNLAIGTEPNAPAMYNEDGSINWMPNAFGNSTFFSNPAVQLERKYQGKTANFISNAVVTYQILPGLSIKNNFGYNSIYSNEYQLNPLTAIKPENRRFIQRSASFY